MPELVIENLSIKFGGIQALKNISLTVKPNSMVGLMGPNGAGKTTLINCVSRIYNPTSGKITFDACDLTSLRGDELTGIGISRTFQDLSFFQHIQNTLVIDYMRLGQFNSREISITSDFLQLKKSREKDALLKKNARRVLDFFRQVREHLEPPEVERDYPFLYGREGFPDLLDLEFYPVENLSFAWRRRLDLARALVSNPKLLLLDEPAQGLAPSEIENLGKTLKLIQSEFGVAALIVEHNVDTLMKISDYVAVMNHGELIASGLPAEVSKNQEVVDIYLGTKNTTKQSGSSIIDTNKVNSAPEIKNRRQGEALLEVKNLDLYYGSAQALFSVSVKFYPREVVSILGTNGSGKSTLMKAICGIEKPSFGEILLKGQKLPLGWPEVSNERGIQFVAQGHVIFPELNVIENLKIGAYTMEKRGLKFKDGLEKIFSYFPMFKEQLKMQAGSLSGGQQQMLAMAQALIGNPELLLLDEPSLGLSPLLVDNLFEIIKKISNEEKCAIVIVEQNVKKALEISDYIYMMSSGLLIGQGSSEQLMKNDDTIKKYLGFQ